MFTLGRQNIRAVVLICNQICALFYANNFLLAHCEFNRSYLLRVQVERFAVKDVNLSTFEMSLNRVFLFVYKIRVKHQSETSTFTMFRPPKALKMQISVQMHLC